MIGQMSIYGKDKVETAIERMCTFEPPEGYHLAFSGGKDSVVIKALADMAGVKYDAHYQITSVDPPELVNFIKEYHPDVKREHRFRKDGRPYTMWNLIAEKKLPPTRVVRYCCEYLKETAGEGRFVVTGIRKAESAKRASRGGLELAEKKSHRFDGYDPDNPTHEMIHMCQTHARRHLNPIIDWTDEDVWEFIHGYNVPYCSLYDEGFTRLGCIGCPLADKHHRKKEFERWPKYKRLYINAFQKMLNNGGGTPTDSLTEKIDLNTGSKTIERWTKPEEVMNWWMELFEEG